MGWREDGTVQRVNPDFTGNQVWQQDASVPINIVAGRQDVHDQDLAQSIAATLHTGSYTGMKADLKMGGFKVVNVADPVNPNDMARFDHIVNASNFDDPSRTLSLIADNGDQIDVVIPAGEGGETQGTVTDIHIGGGLAGGVNPIQVIGDIYLPTVITAQTFSNGVKTLDVDTYGRVTGGSGNAFAPSNLSVGNRNTDLLEIVCSTGDNVELPIATASLAGIIDNDMHSIIGNLPSNFQMAQGTWKPEFTAFGGNQTVVGADNIGYYIRLENFVFIWGNIDWQNVGAGATNLIVTGIPYNPNSQGSDSDGLVSMPLMHEFAGGGNSVSTKFDEGDSSDFCGLFVNSRSQFQWVGVAASNSGAVVPPGTVSGVPFDLISTFGNQRFWGAYETDEAF